MLNKSNQLKLQLNKLVNQYGLNHPLVLKCSQELDNIILEIQLQKKYKIDNQH